MQKDFHFYNIYTLCRIAGFEHGTAKIIAYASQYVDDAKYGDILEFENGGRYRQVMTAHKFVDLGSLSQDTFYKIFVPFHFLPGEKKNALGYYENLICTANSNVAQEMIHEVLSYEGKPYFFHRLGIALHTYTDTWAHQNFSGVLREENRVDDIRELEMEPVDFFDESFIHVASDFIPAIGHGKAGSLPDIPYKKWQYGNYQNEVIEVNNGERFIEASKEIFRILSAISGNPQLAPWEKIEIRLRRVYEYQGNLENRMDAWKYWIKMGVFYFKNEDIDYDEKAWFRDAVEVVDKRRGIFRRKDGFGESNWKYYHDAAAIQIFYILNELLPKYNLFCG